MNGPQNAGPSLSDDAATLIRIERVAVQGPQNERPLIRTTLKVDVNVQVRAAL